MSQAQRVERWIVLAEEAKALAQDYLANMGLRLEDKPGLDMRMSSARGQARGLDFRLLPFPAWEGGRHFAWLLSILVDDDRPTSARIEIVDDLVVTADRLISTLRTTSARPRADLDD